LQIFIPCFSTFEMVLNFKKIFFLLFLICSDICYSRNIDLGSWNILNIKYEVNKKVSFFAETQLRSLKFYNHFHYYEYKEGVNYKFYQKSIFTLAAGSYQTYSEGGDFVIPKNNNEISLNN